MSEIFNLPDVGEGLTEAEIVSWKVKPGDSVRVNDVIVEIETAKSLVELPCPYAGVVERLLVDEGATVEVGTPIIEVETAAGGGAPAGESGGAAAAAGEDLVPTPEPRPEETGGEEPAEDRQAVLVGYGPRSTSAKRRPRKTTHAPARGAGAPPTRVDHGRNMATEARTAEIPHDQRESGRERARVLAKPPVRKLAKDLGVDLTTVEPSGPGGTVTREDVHAAAAAPPPDHAKAVRHAADGWDGLPREERIPIRSVRKTTAANVVKSAFTAPHVTEFVTVDATRTVRLVDRLRESREFRDVRLSPMAVVARAMCVAVRRTPEVNAQWDDDAGEIVLRRYVNLGIAAATPRGLVVPNIKDADRLSLHDLAVAINELAETAREGKTPPDDMTGGTISITNVGVFGVDTGTPILPPGEAAIIAFGAVKQQPWVHKGKVKPRWVTTLGLSFDHRLVDGEQGS
ncbi:MAG: dihydrolipoamide acetyltransferase family protein, partial [Actinomycetota bacterium]